MKPTDVLTSLGLAAGLLLAGSGAGAPAGAMHRAAAPLLIFYGWIPGTKAAFTRMAARMAGYPVVVLGSGDEWPSPGSDRSEAMRMIRTDRSTRYYGYVDLGVTGGQPDHPIGDIARALRAWRRMGAKGVLLDCAGPDYGVSRSRLRAAVSLGHQDGLRLLVNAWDPQAVIGAGLRRSDAWLAENWVMADGRVVPRDAADWGALPRVRALGVQIWMTATDAAPPSRRWVDTWVPRTVAAVGGSAVAVSGPDYSSQSNAIAPAWWITGAGGSP